MTLVVDASVALAWALPDESSAYADAVLAVVERDGVPELWSREIANGLAVAYLRKRITSADERAFLVHEGNEGWLRQYQVGPSLAPAGFAVRWCL
jgi:predicted nucleic acid-binding protein